MRLIKLVTGVAVLVSVVAGCTSKQNGTAISPVDNSSSEKTATSSAANDYGAPRVSTPLDATRFLSQPCAVLTSAQLQSLTLRSPGEPDTDSAIAKAAGPACLWRSSNGSTNGVSFTTGNKRGLADLYRGHEQGAFKGYFEPTTVDGYPAVFKDVADYRGDGTCNLSVGVTDSLTFLASELGPFKGSASCDRAKQVATAVVQTLKGGG